MKSTVKMNYVLFFALFILVLSCTSAGAASMTFITEIPIPNWTTNPTTGVTNASFDLLSYDPGRQIMYSADRPNHGVDVIDTKTNTLLGIIPVPSACANSANVAQCPSGIQVAPDVRQLIVTDRGAAAAGGNVYIYDLTASGIPAAPAKTLTLPNARGTDELNYDPINKRAYVNNTNNAGDPTGRYFMTVIDVNPASATYGQSLGQIPIASGANSPEQPRFDPKDGFIYTTTGGNSTLLRIDPNFVLDPNNPANNVGAIKTTIQLPGCSPAGFDVNPADNLGLIGCNPGAPNGASQKLINLNTDTIVRTIDRITATDVLAFDPSLGEWFTASQNLIFSNGCPAAQNNPAVFPQVGGIFDNSNAGLQVTCSGQGAHGLGVDPDHNYVYVPVALFPSSGGGVGNPGILVFQATAIPEPSSLLLVAFGLAGLFAAKRTKKV